MRRTLVTALLLMVGFTVGLAPAATSTPSRNPQTCFLSSDWSGWKASPDSKALYIRVGARVLRLDLAQACLTCRASVRIW